MKEKVVKEKVVKEKVVKENVLEKSVWKGIVKAYVERLVRVCDGDYLFFLFFGGLLLSVVSLPSSS